jgi:hypothetical protein
MNSHITKHMLENANKFTFLIEAYPEKTVPEVISLFQMPPVDTNAAIWAAVELGMVKEMDIETYRSEVLKKPESWQFGETVTELEDALTYCFEKLNADEKDMEENYLSNWTQGYPAHDVLIATKHLLADNVLHEYEIEDGENAYIFYSLKANAGKNWGAKQFKENPLTGEPNTDVEQDNDAPDAPSEQ